MSRDFKRLAINTGGGDIEFPGTIDEAHVANVIRSTSWMTTEYNNQRPGSTFISVGPEEAR